MEGSPHHQTENSSAPDGDPHQTTTDKSQQDSTNQATKPFAREREITNSNLYESLRKIRSAANAMAFFKWFRANFPVEVSVTTYIFLIKKLKRSNELESVAWVFRDIREQKIQPTFDLFFCFKDVFEDIPVAETLDIWADFTHVLLDGNMVVQASKLAARFKDEDLTANACGALMKLYGWQGFYKRMYKLYEYMRDKGIVPLDSTATLLSRVLLERKNWVILTDLISWLRSSGQSLDTIDSEALISFYNETGQKAEAFALMNSKVASGINPTCQEWVCLLLCCDSVEEVEATYKKMPAEHRKEIRIMNSVALQLMRFGSVDKAELWIKTYPKYGLWPSQSLAVSLLFAYLKEGSYSSAIDRLLPFIESYGSDPLWKVYMVLLELFQESVGEFSSDSALLLRAMGHCNVPAHSAVLSLLEMERTDEVAARKAVQRIIPLFPRQGRHELVYFIVSAMYRKGLVKASEVVRQEFLKEKQFAGFAFSTGFRGSSSWIFRIGGVSIRLTCAFIRHELQRLRRRFISMPHLEPLSTYAFVIGLSKEDVAETRMIRRVTEILRGIGSPFEKDPAEVGLVVAQGWKVKEWLVKEDVGHLLGRSNWTF